MVSIGFNVFVLPSFPAMLVIELSESISVFVAAERATRDLSFFCFIDLVINS